MGSFQIIPHTADTKIQVSAESLEGLFKSALSGMNHILKKGSCNDQDKLPFKKKLKIKSIDPTSLLIDFLNEVLTNSYIDNVIFCKVDFKTLNERTLEAEILGLKNENFEEDIKAVSYHGAKVVKNEAGIYQTDIVFDI